MMPAGDDIDRIMAVMRTAFDPAFGEAWSRAQVENSLLMGNTRYVLIGTDGAAPAECAPVAGFAMLRNVLDEDELLLFAIAPEWRRRGLGRCLLTIVLNQAKAAGKTRVFLEMRRGNTAESLYRAQGFKPIGERPKYYRSDAGDRIDAVTFACLMGEAND